MSERPVALITGGTRGIGFGIARALAAEGWTLLLTGLRPAVEVRDTLAQLSDAGAAVDYIAADVADASARAEVVETIRRKFGTVHALVNNAGRAPRVRADLLDATEDSFEEVLRTNLQGPYFLTQAVARLFVQQ